MSYTVLARRYRSQSFAELVGQEAVAATLKGAIESGRIAHAYLFCGSRGVGKTSLARILAKSLNCTKADKPTVQPCNKCDVCKAVAVGEDMDVVEIDGASNNGVEQVRELRQNAVYKPARGRFKIYIIDEVHMLSGAAFNALLKTLEEPPAHVKFIFATTEPNKLPITVRSRCQRFDFRNIPTAEIAEHLKVICKEEGVKADDEAIRHVARCGAGSMRDSLSLLDQLMSAGEKKLTVELITTVLGVPPATRVIGLFDAVFSGDAPAAFKHTAELLAAGVAVETLVEGLLEYLRTMLLIAAAGADTDLLDVDGETAKRAAEHAAKTDATTISQMMSLATELQRNVRRNSAARALVDAAVFDLCRFKDTVAVADLVERAAGSAAAATSARPSAPSAAGGDWQKKNAERAVAPARPAVAVAPPTPQALAASGLRPPASSPVPPASSLQPPASDLAAIAACWPKMIADLTPVRQALAPCLARGRPVAIEGETLTIEFPADRAYDLKMCDERAHREVIAAALQAAGAGKWLPAFRTGAFDPAAPPTQAAPGTVSHVSRQDVAAVLADPVISAAVDLFGARVVNIEKEE